MHLRHSLRSPATTASPLSLADADFPELMALPAPTGSPVGGLEWSNAAGACGPLTGLAQLLGLVELVGTEFGWRFLVIKSPMAPGAPFAQACGSLQAGIAVELGLSGNSWVQGRASEYSPGSRDIGAFGFRYFAFDDELFTAPSATIAMWDWVALGQHQAATVLRSARWRTDARNRW